MQFVRFGRGRWLCPMAARRRGHRPISTSQLLKAGPVAKFDLPGGQAFRELSPKAKELRTTVAPGQLNEVIWMCWTGNNPVPAHLELCKETVERNSGLPVILVTPENLLHYWPRPHPLYDQLHLAHRADYLRCCLLHTYGGMYLDMDTICLRSLRPLLSLPSDVDAVGYDGSPWGELIGISALGPIRPQSPLTELWFNALHGRLQRALRLSEEKRGGTKNYPFYWQEILRDIFVPASRMEATRIRKSLQAHNPSQEDLWSVEPATSVLGPTLRESHILILNNAIYGEELEDLTREQILGGPAVLSQVLRMALALPHPRK